MESPSWTELGMKELEGQQKWEICKKVQESRLKWYGRVLRREDEYVGKRVMVMEVPGKRRKGRPKRMWLDSIQERFVGENSQGRKRKTDIDPT